VSNPHGFCKERNLKCLWKLSFALWQAARLPSSAVSVMTSGAFSGKRKKTILRSDQRRLCLLTFDPRKTLRRIIPIAAAKPCDVGPANQVRMPPKHPSQRKNRRPSASRLLERKKSLAVSHSSVFDTRMCSRRIWDSQ